MAATKMGLQIWKTSGLEDFQTTYKKSSRRIPGSLPDEFQEVFQTTSRNSSDRVFTDLGLIYMFFRSGSDFGRPMGSLLGSLLKYNAPGSLPDGVFFHIKWSLSLSLERNDL
ncbi:hypothetical protein F2Q68_00006322 [Brassica cretica]|uniref:Uncharacterized protein n=1 Tax=Brassica cretica TaxID=69181 RepID=A0A8S9JFD8_BRACR|nr:hypothetical protein F2Q68_00006322 [Brassica cretica]